MPRDVMQLPCNCLLQLDVLIIGGYYGKGVCAHVAVGGSAAVRYVIEAVLPPAPCWHDIALPLWRGPLP